MYKGAMRGGAERKMRCNAMPAGVMAKGAVMTKGVNV